MLKPIKPFVLTRPKVVLGVTGGRDYSNSTLINVVLSKLHWEWKFTDFVNGYASGADRLCRIWAAENNLVIHDYVARWNDLNVPGAVIRTRVDGTQYNAKAGLDRNQIMVDKGNIDLLVKFPGNAGTEDMLKRAKAANIMYVVVNEEGTWHYGDNYL